VSPESLGKFSQTNVDVSWEQLLEKTRDFRFGTFTRDATLQRLTILKFPATSEGGISGVYLAACKSNDGRPFFLVCRSAPSRLPRDETLNEPIRFSGFFYNSVRLAAGRRSIELGRMPAEEEDDKVVPSDSPVKNCAPLFVVNRFAWYPETAGDAGAAPGQVNVPFGNVELASQGVDVGLFDYVRKRNSRPLAQQDSISFYQMLEAARAVGRDVQADVKPGKEKSNSTVGFVDLVGAPAKHIGARVAITGSLRQCVRIEVPADAHVSIQADRPLGHYYQVSLFPDLGGRKVVTRSGNGNDLSFDRYPVTVCLSALPEGMTPETIAGKTATVDGFFYRLIKYQSQKTEAEGLDGMVSPLIMASGIDFVATANAERAVDNLMNLFLWLMLGAVVVVIIWKILNWRRHVFSKTRDGAKGAFDFPDQIDVSNIDEQNL
jgi:hypothetical protein